MPQPHPTLGPWARPLPRSRADCALVFAVRRMATLGLRDATAALLMLELFGARFRRPLVLLRAFVLELSLAAQRPIQFARCCTPAMTDDERLILALLKTCVDEPGEAQETLRRLTQAEQVCEPLAAAVVFARVAAGPGQVTSPASEVDAG